MHNWTTREYIALSASPILTMTGSGSFNREARRSRRTLAILRLPSFPSSSAFIDVADLYSIDTR